MNCMYCTRPGKERMPPGQSAIVCDGCWVILQDPKTALPFLRGHLTMELRGTMPEAELQEKINAFMKHASQMKKPG